MASGQSDTTDMNIDARDIIGDATPALFEDVEQRTLMSVASMEGHVLSVTTEEGNDVIELQLNDDASELTATVNGQNEGSFAANAIYVIDVNAGNGNNTVALDPRIGATTAIVTGSGRDVVYGGMGNDFISTGGGRDIVDARAGNDMIYGGSGNDKINAGSGNDYVNAGSGNDSISADGGKDKLVGKRGDDKFYADADDTVQTDGGNNVVYKIDGIVTRDDGYQAPIVHSISIVDADTGAVVTGYGNLTADTQVSPGALPAHYTIVANVDSDAESVYFNAVGDKSLVRCDSDGTFSMTPDSTTGKFTPWQPTVGGTYTIKVAANTADEMRGITGGVFQINLTMKKEAAGAGTTAPTPPTQTPAPAPTPSSDPAAPKIKLNVLTRNIVAGQGFHAEATGTTLAGYQAEDAKFEWNFGDPSGKFNALPGFNAAHVYEKAGKYTATLTVTAPGGKVSTQAFVVDVKAVATKTIYVAANGNDTLEGATQDQAVKTLGRAAQLAGDDTRILIRRGDTFDVVGTATIANDDVSIDTYGVGASPIIRYAGPRTLTTLIYVTSAAENVLINGLTFTSIYDKDTDQTGMCHAINCAGTNVTIRGNTFLDVGYGVNCNGNPNQVYFVNNAAPLKDGLRGYMIWTQGSNLVIVGNTVANSTREHAIRAAIFTNINISYNTLSNLDRRNSDGDAGDFSKCSINVQRGSYAYVADNDVHDGPISIGPLGGGDGANQKEMRFYHGVIEGNTVENTQIIVQHGTIGTTIRDNLIDFEGESALIVRGWDEDYGRGTVDLVIDHNVAIDHLAKGRFLELTSHTDQTVLTNNVFIAPNLTPNYYAAAALYIWETNVSSFKTINGNVWPTAENGKLAGSPMFLGNAYVSSATWNDVAGVGTDRVEDVSESSPLSITNSMLKAA